MLNPVLILSKNNKFTAREGHVCILNFALNCPLKRSMQLSERFQSHVKFSHISCLSCKKPPVEWLLHHLFEVKGRKCTSENVTTQPRDQCSLSGQQGWNLCKRKVSLNTTFRPYLLALAQHLTSTHRCSRPDFINNWKQSLNCATFEKYLHPRCVSTRREWLQAEPQQWGPNKTLQKTKNLHAHACLMAGQIKLGTTWHQTTTNNATSINKNMRAKTSKRQKYNRYDSALKGSSAMFPLLHCSLFSLVVGLRF